MPALTTMGLAAAAAISGVGVASGKGADWGLIEKGTDAVKDVFSPDLPPPAPIPDPVAKQSTLAATQAEERSLINRAGLAGTKKVRSLLGKTESLGGGGS